MTGEKQGPTLSMKGSCAVEDWRARFDAAAQAIRAHKAEIDRRRGAAKAKRAIAIIVVLVAAIALGFMVSGPAGIFVAIAGSVAPFFLIKLPPPDYIGPERLQFVSGVLAELAGIAPKSQVALEAQLDDRRGRPAPMLPSGSGTASAKREQADAWLKGTLSGIPGLRLAWEATDWRTVTLARRRGRRKVKHKGKLAVARRLAVRLDADRAIYALKPGQFPAGNPKEGVVQVRELPQGFSVRARRDTSAKTALSDPRNLPASFEALRKEGRREFFCDAPAALVTLMKLAEGRLAPKPAKGGTQ